MTQSKQQTKIQQDQEQPAQKLTSTKQSASAKKSAQADQNDQAKDQQKQPKTAAANSCQFSAFSIFSNVVQIVLILLLVVVAVVGFGARIPFLAKQGLQFYAVTSGSMEPAIPTGALIKVGKYKLDDLQQGDVITFTVPSNSPQPQIVTHRIQQVAKEEEVVSVGQEDEQNNEQEGEQAEQQAETAETQEGEQAEQQAEAKEKKIVSYQFTTQGDANNKPDDHPVKPGDILGKYQWHLPYLGYISAFTQTAAGFIILVVIPAIVLIVWEVVSLVLHFRQQAETDSQEEIKRLKQQLAQQTAEAESGS